MHTQGGIEIQTRELTHTHIHTHTHTHTHTKRLNHIISAQIINDIIFDWSNYAGQLDARGNKEKEREAK